MKYREYKNPDYPTIATEILKYWEERDIFHKSISLREGSESFTFYEGPPSANGTPGIHHVMARTVKDLFCRYKTQKGFQVKRKAGWDTHGLPVELQVEKELGITKEDIGKKISVEDYNLKCREAVMKFKDEWDDLTRKIGYWVDLDEPYITFEHKYVETLWYLLKQLYKKGLLYKGYTIQPFSPAAGTGLSSHELNQPGTYKNVKDTSVTAQFKVIRNKQSEFLFDGDKPVYILAWTTTPWTLPGNCALAIGKKIEYLIVETYNPYLFNEIRVVIAKDRLSSYFNEKTGEVDFEDYKPEDKLIPFKIIDSFSGDKLLGIVYEQLLPYVQPEGKAFTVIPGDFVTTEDGTGIVHTASLFGADDFRVCKENDIASITVKDENGFDVPVVDRQARFVKEITDFAGRYVREEFYDDKSRNDPEFKPTDVLIAIKLKEEGKAFKVEKYEHSYPHCWRTDKPVLYYPLDSWFVKTTALKGRMVELNDTINWKPKSTGAGRFGNWLENLVDWNLSRSRFWGTPLPIWATEDRKEEKCIGSVEELTTEMQKSIKIGFMVKSLFEGKEVDLHRPYVDEIILVSDSGQKMFREQDLVDVWFDSGAMPYAQWHYPFENQDKFEANYPADFISEGVDQTRGWFFTLHAIATLVYDSVAFKNVVSTGLVLDKNGNKMSKRLGNTIDPLETLRKFGPDATRWYLIANANPWDNFKFDLDGVAEVQRRFFGTLFNTYSFFALYANLDRFSFNESKQIPLGERTESDRWIISKLNTLKMEVNIALDDYEPTKAARAIQNFVSDDLSNWYVRLNRKRYWVGDYNDDKKAAYETLYECLLTISKLGAPIAPFYMERLYHDLEKVSDQERCESVHHCFFPQADTTLIDQDLEEKMQLAQNISSLVHSLRRKHKIKVRQPLSKIMVPVLNNKTREQISAIEELIASEVNIKTIDYIDDASGIIKKRVKPNFSKLGKRYGSKMKSIAAAVSQMSGNSISELERDGAIELGIDGEMIKLGLEDVEIFSEDIPGWSVASDNGLTVALDITLTDDLKKEGIARELVNRIQNIRKDLGLDVQDKIVIKTAADDNFVQMALQEYETYICRETQATELKILEKLDEGQEVELNDYRVKVLVKK
ncbi:MAG: isoleucine--tRNA ligase [Bacteroidetes bacterium]|nr:isoleucine--tRNA ligase [Bacteroidota bacterium]MDA1120065.1 isoleucine--tRNA ligase [Bacteroidota bacterium]